MQFCPISPVPWLNRFCDQSDKQLALAQYMIKDASYRSYYQECVDRGDVVILDNGAYEKDLVSFDELADLISEIKPEYYIIPDEVNTFLSNQISLDWLTYLRKTHPDLLNVKRLWAVQADPGNLNQFINSYLMGISNADGVALVRDSTYGLSDEDPYMKRVQFIKYLQDKNIWRNGFYIHALGMINGHVDELTDLDRLGVHSIDSSSPVYRGLMGYALQQEWPNFPLLLYPPMIAESRMEDGPAGLVLAQKNLNKVFKLCQHQIPVRQLI